MNNYQQKFVPIIGDYVKLRLSKETDYPVIKNILSDLKTMEHLQYMSLASDEWTMERFRGRYNKNKHDFNNLRTNLIVTIKDSGNIVGDCGLNNIILDHRRAEFGIILHHSVWGTAVCAECHYLLLNYGFEKLNLHRIEWSTSTKNIRMRRFLENINCKLESIRNEYWQINSCFKDECVYVLFEYQWPLVKKQLNSIIQKKVRKSDLSI